MVTSISFADTNLVDAITTPSIVTVVDAVNPVPYTGTTVPAAIVPIPAGIFSTEGAPFTVREPLATDKLASGEVAEIVTVRPAADPSTGTEITITGNPGNCPIPPVA